MDRVKGKVAIVTGAGRGLGKAEALLLAKEGAKVVITDIEATGTESAQEIRNTGGQAIFIKHDVSKEANWKEVIDRTMAEFGTLDVLVNNAGVFLAKTIDETSLEEWRRLMSINLDGVFLGTKYAARAMRKTGGGSIVNISSVASLVATFDDTSAYCASKGAVRIFTKAAALEYCKEGHDYNIRVNSVNPWGIQTEMVASFLRENNARRGVDFMNPIGHLGEPDDVAYAVLYLASDESKYLTGTEVTIDGGWTAK